MRSLLKTLTLDISNDEVVLSFECALSIDDDSRFRLNNIALAAFHREADKGTYRSV